MKRNQWFKWIGVAGLGLMLSVLAAPAAQALTVNCLCGETDLPERRFRPGNLVGHSEPGRASQVSLGFHK